MNELADEHIYAVQQTIECYSTKQITANQAAERLKLLGYNFEETWKMLQENFVKPKVIKLG
jgi:hypothetical protein